MSWFPEKSHSTCVCLYTISGGFKGFFQFLPPKHGEMIQLDYILPWICFMENEVPPKKQSKQCPLEEHFNMKSFSCSKKNPKGSGKMARNGIFVFV